MIFGLRLNGKSLIAELHFTSNMIAVSKNLQVLKVKLTLKAPIMTAADDKFLTSFLIFERNKEYFMRIICQQTILKNIMAFLLVLKSDKIWNCRLLQKTSDSLNEILPIKITREKFQRKWYFSLKKIVGSTLDLSTKAVFSLDKYQLKNMGWKLCFCYSTYRK